MINISRTDIRIIDQLLKKCAPVVDRNASSTYEQDLARRCRKMSKKLNKKLNNENNK